MARRNTTPAPASMTSSAAGGPGEAVSKTQPEIPVVAIGASAGGLEPIGRLLSQIPPQSGLAFVVVQHLDPVSTSALPDILGQHTDMTVEAAADRAAVLPNRVYVIPPGAYLTIADGRLRLTSTEGKSPTLPIDVFLRSLARDCGRRGIGVILSGSGTDGAAGLKALTDAGGLTIAQDPGEARHDGMPRHAAQVARPDFVLPVHEIPAVLARYAAHDYLKVRPPASGAPEPNSPPQSQLAGFVDVLKSTTGKDFGLYKTGTLIRRIERRMALHGIDTKAEYLALVRRNSAEGDALLKDLLINVTAFFRDPDAFAALAEHISSALRSLPAERPFRAWVSGCSTGEEAYSLGMLLLEQTKALGRHSPVQIFATDIDEEALEVARAGLYPDSIRADVSADRVSHFFVGENGRLRVSGELRSIITFSRHDILHDPPFSRLDLVSCRNVLIYLAADAQRQALASFNFALIKGGLLILGSAESVNASQGLFEPLDEKSRIYRRRGRTTRLPISQIEHLRGADPADQMSRSAMRRPPAVAETMQRMLLQTYAPAAVMVNRQLEPVQYLGAIDRYLQLMPGDPNQDVLASARDGLRAELLDAISRAFRSKRRVTALNARIVRHGTSARVTIEAQRVPDEQEDLVLVAFFDDLVAATLPGAPPVSNETAEQGSEMASLRQQLAETRRELNRTIHELRDANETLKAKNEEAMSLNEEFLSTNEELESSKEELQSLNEELTTVNNQLQRTLEQQQQTSNDLANLLNSSAVATILLDENLNIKIFNPRMRDLFALIETDIGRPLADLLPRFSDPELTADALAARSTGASREREIHALSGAWYMRSAMPYRSETDEIRGAVITFTDVTRLKEEQIASQAGRRYAELIVETATEPMAVIDEGLRLVSANQALLTEFAVPPDLVGTGSLRSLQSPVLTNPPLLDLIMQFLAKGDGVAKSEIEVALPNGGQHNWRATIRTFRAPPPQSPIVLLALENITDQRRVIRRQFQLLIDALPAPILATDPQGRIKFASTQMEGLFGYSAAELVGRGIAVLVPPELRERHAVLHNAFLAKPDRRPLGTGLAVEGIAKDGTRIPLDVGLSPVDTADGPLIVVAIHDLREIKKGEAEREQLRTQLAADLADMQRLHEMATRLVGTTDLPAMLDEILTATIALQDADFGNIQLYDPVADALKIVVNKGFSQKFLDHFGDARADDGSVCGRAMQARARIIVEDVEADAAFAPHRAVAAEAGYRAVQSTPIFVRDGAVKGMLSTHFRKPHRPSERDLRLTDLYMRMAAELIERAQAEQAVQAAQHAADEANRAKSRFLAAAGHDLRQPLQSIILLQGVLEQQVANAHARATLASLEDATGQMAGMIDSLLDLDQIESGSVRVELADLSVASLQAQMVNDFAALAEAKGLELRSVAVSALVGGDRRLLVRMLGNLLSNAIDYTDRGKILIGGRRQGDTVRIEVWDTGIGIPPDKVHALFDEYYRANRPDDGKSGLGLGLLIVRRFADLLGYRIDVRSWPGKGTMFALIIPGARFMAPAGSEVGEEMEGAASRPAVLLIQEDGVQLDALGALLQLKGFRVAAARTGADAIAHLHEGAAFRPDLIVADFDLPGSSSGADIVRRIRDELNAEIPALLLSGHRPEAPLPSDKAGQLQFLVKPVKPATLLATVEALVKRVLPDWQSRKAVERRMPQPALPPPNGQSEIAVIDDDPGIRDSARTVLETQGYRVETFASGEAFLARPDYSHFRCLIVDVTLSGMGGLELQDRLKAAQFTPPIIFMTGSGDVPLAVRAMREGAADFLLKPVDSTTLRESVARVLEQGAASVPAQSLRAEAEVRLGTLTRREREILDRIVMGQLNKNIAADLGISERTTEHHRQGVMRKMGVKSLAMLVRMIASVEGERM